ncbi:hypothetical protein HOT82_gp020 [Gordonia phage Ronaldo]|uniref:Uncharacterized protein n=2 Tax=Ronaldovirus ronaldo TaxID=2734270 RepID=A0A6B9L8G8_9CAUD|nr:hypothetical protein HOT82_gp020 [Gordonia phage Ronaldo]AXN53582.1 hypothetical protein SEA_RONALDO_20 [Gordonia phage Ronaldo]QHB38136.1 hypothetical protein SEA_VOLT_19 [Gordonia phage Volt]
MDTYRDRHDRIWFGDRNNDECLWHAEESDTDMGDMTWIELVSYVGPMRKCCNECMVAERWTGHIRHKMDCSEGRR